MEKITGVFNVYDVNELSKTAENKARVQYENFVSEYVESDIYAETVGAVENVLYSLGLQADYKIDEDEGLVFNGVSFRYCYPWMCRSYDDKILTEMHGNRLRTYLVNNYGHMLTTPKRYVGRNGNFYGYSFTKKVQRFTKEVRYLLTPFYGFLSGRLTTDYTLTELVRDCLRFAHSIAIERIDKEYSYIKFRHWCVGRKFFEDGTLWIAPKGMTIEDTEYIHIHKEMTV